MTGATLLPLAAYLIGSLPVSLWVGRRWGGRDLRTTGSGNLGATNVLRVAGRGPALLAFAGDAAKGAMPVLLGQQLGASEGYLALAVLAAVLGHMFSPWVRFRGGKGVATAFGGFLLLAPVVAGCALLIFVGLVTVYRYVSLGSICAVLAFPLIWLLLARFGSHEPPGEVTLAAAVATGFLVLWRHAANIRRLIGGSEAQIGRSVGRSAAESSTEAR